MFGMGMPEILLILAIALIVIGPKKLPDIAKSLGKAMGEFKRATHEFKDSINLDVPDRKVKPIDIQATTRKDKPNNQLNSFPDPDKDIVIPKSDPDADPGKKDEGNHD
ncbi:MAG: twin-arginine translocase TatA/TatE family subunit [Proteobacteria bacterium]|nr:twin-arginine translocase TatA/TatE family subunit [Pseudomonadota bacterium]